MKKILEKKALSPVIATILLILLTVSAVVIIFAAIIPFVKEKMEETKECSAILNSADSLTIDRNAYYCYYNNAGGTGKIVNLTIHKGQIEIKGIKISILGEGNSEIVDIEEGMDGTEINVKMLDGSDTLVLPGKGGEKTYSISTDLSLTKSVVIAPIMSSGKICKETDEIDLEDC